MKKNVHNKVELLYAGGLFCTQMAWFAVFLILFSICTAGVARAEDDDGCCDYAVYLTPTNKPLGSCCDCDGPQDPALAVTCCKEEDDEPEILKDTVKKIPPEPCDPNDLTYTVTYKFDVECNGKIESYTLEEEYTRDCGDGCTTCTKGAGTSGSNLPTDKDPPLQMFRLGMSTEGKSTGFLRMEVATNAAGIVYAGTINPVIQTQDADVVYDTSDPQYLRQVMAAECLVTIATNASSGYSINYYHPGQVEPELDTNGFYQTLPDAQPFASYSIGRSGASLAVTGGFSGASDEILYTPGPANQPWSLQRGSVVQTLSFASVGANQVETRALSAIGGQPAEVIRKTRAPVAGAMRLIARSEGPEDAPRETRWYYNDEGRMIREEHSDGSWTRYQRVDGTLTATVTPLGDAAPDAPDSLCRVVSNNYATVDANDVNDIEWSTEPRTVTMYEAGVAVSRTYHAYYYTAGGEKVEIEERAATPEASYGAAGNLRTKRTWFAKNEAEPWSEELRYVESPGGLLESHVYEAGNLVASGPDPAGWSFTADPTGLLVRATADFGTTNAPGGIACQTRRQVSIQDQFGRSYLDETWICTGTSNYTREAWVATTRDALGRATAVRRSDGALAETTWGCCGPESQTAADGTVTDTAYDALQRPVLATREGEGAQPDLFSETAYDAVGHGTFRRTFSGGLSQSTTNTYDLAGRLTWSRGPDGVETHYSYTSNSTITVRGGLTNLSVRFADGRAHYTEQNGVRQQTHAYGVDPDGTQWTTVYTGPEGDDSPVWTKTTTDPLGRTIAQIRPGFGGDLLVTSNFYDSANNLVRAERWTSGVECRLLDVQLFTYDSLGNLLLTCQDLDLDGQIDLAGPDRVTGQAARYVELSGDWYEESASWTYPDSGSAAAPLTNAIARTRLTGLGSAYSADGATGLLTAESVSIDARGNQTVSRTVVARDSKTVYQITDTPDSTVAALTVTVNGLVQSSRSSHDLTATYAYDALGRQVAVQDARGAVHSRGYDDAGRVAWESDPATNGTWYAYDALGRRIAVTNALGDVTHTEYDLEGRVVKTYGATYPVEYGYDAFGRMVSMKTFRDEQGAGDETCWFYDDATGLLTNKVYADGKGTAYTYTSDGQLASRIWARGVTTTYAYTNGSMIAINYSDSTPAVAFTYDRLGRQKVAQTFLSAHHFAYDGLDLVSETVVDPLTSASNVIARSTDALGRPAGIALSNSPYDVSYAYDAYGRFIAVTAQVHILTHGYTYGYLPGSDLVATMANSHGHTATRTYDPVLPHITRVHNGFTGGRTISQYDYTYDALGRRTAIGSSGEAFTFSNANDLAAFNLYGYNTRSEVTSAARYWGNDTGDTDDAVDGQQYAYAFDPIGNRITAAEGDTSRTASYTANELNQYSQRTVPGVKELAGTALADATVTVNELPSDRYGPWWRHAFEVDNASAAAYTQAVVTAVYNPPGTNDPDVVTSATGRVFVAQTPEAYTYDDDGNLTQDGRFTYTWDAENRLISATTRDGLPADLPRVRVTHQYDHQSRRIATSRETWSGTAWQPAGTNRYLYDGWNVVAETRSASPANTNLYIWGLDLSGSLQGAGGIGGLLTVRKRLDDGTGIVRNYDYLFDANGNVVQEIFRTDGAINAHYEYDPFGNTVAATGVDATDNPFRFSTKWFDNDTGLGYWGYRWYSPRMGRWLSRDPIGEDGGCNIYGFLANTGDRYWDWVGLAPYVPKMGGGPNPDFKVEYNYGSIFSTWSYGYGAAFFTDSGAKAAATAFYKSIWGSWGDTGLLKGEISVSCDSEGNISFNPRRSTDIFSVDVSAAVDMLGQVDEGNPKSGSISVDLAVSYKEHLSVTASLFGITVTDPGAGITAKSGKTVGYVCVCKECENKE